MVTALSVKGRSSRWSSCTKVVLCTSFMSNTGCLNMSNRAWPRHCERPLLWWKLRIIISVLLKTSANISSWRLSLVLAFRLHGGMFNGSLAVGAPSSSLSIFSINSAEFSGSVLRRRSIQNCASPTAHHSKHSKFKQLLNISENNLQNIN